MVTYLPCSQVIKSAWSPSMKKWRPVWAIRTSPHNRKSGMAPECQEMHEQEACIIYSPRWQSESSPLRPEFMLYHTAITADIWTTDEQQWWRRWDHTYGSSCQPWEPSTRPDPGEQWKLLKIKLVNTSLNWLQHIKQPFEIRLLTTFGHSLYQHWK